MPSDLASAEQVAMALGATKKADYWMARCLGHDDDKPSMSIRQKGDLCLLHCFKGCDDEDLLGAAESKTGLSIKAKGRKRSEPWQPSDTETPCVFEEKARWSIRDADGVEVAVHLRKECVREGCAKRPHKDMPWTKGAKPASMLYGLEKLKRFPDPVVVICEGEKAADAAAHLKLLSLGTVGGASGAPSEEVLSHLANRKVILWPDNDDAGRAHMGRIAGILRGLAQSVKILSWPDAPPKGDAADFPGTREDFNALLEQGESKDFTGQLCSAFHLGVDDTVREIARRADGDRQNFVTTSIPGLDQRLGGGLRRGTVTSIGAPTGGMKTALLCQMCFEAAKGVSRFDGSYAVPPAAALIVSPEMHREELQFRELCRRIRIDPRTLEGWWTHEKDVKRRNINVALLADAAEFMKRNPPPVALAHFEVSNMDATKGAVEEAMLAFRDPPLGLVVIDYAQEMTSDTGGARYRAVAEVLNDSIEIAIRNKLAVVVSSQLNKFLDKDGNDAYAFREARELENRPANALHFILKLREDEKGLTREVEKAYFKGLKVRSRTPFKEFEVRAEPRFFSITDKPLAESMTEE